MHAFHPSPPDWPRPVLPIARGLFIVAGLALAGPALGCPQSLFQDLGSDLTPVDDKGHLIEVADFDGDGIVDILKGGDAYAVEPDLVLLLGRGDGRFDPSPHPLPPLDSAAQDFAVGDVDSDGDLDVFIGLQGYGYGSQDRLWLNEGGGLFADASVLLPAVLTYTASVLLEDLDGDGDLDAVGGNFWNHAPSTYLLLNDGFGVFTDASSQVPATLGFSVFSLAAGDLDGDGDVDLVLGCGDLAPGCNTGGGCCDFSAAQSRIWINDGQAGFTEGPGRLPDNASNTRDVAVGDVDGDGDLDLVLGNRGAGWLGWQNEDQLLVNDGSGFFSESSGLAEHSEDTSRVALCDLNGDGSLDLVRGGDRAHCNSTPTRARTWLGDGAGHFTEVPLPFDAQGQPSVIEPADVDGDGDLDLILGITSQALVLLGDGSGSFVDATGRGDRVGGAAGDSAVGDFDGDGDLDRLFGDRLMRNDGSGWFTADSSTLPASAAPSESVEAADLDGDGDLDAVIARQDENEVWTNDGTGTFQRLTAGLPFDASWTRSIAIEDLDGDGDLDVLFGNQSAQNRLWWNDGHGVFSDATDDLPQRADSTRDLALGDVDGDGDLDLIVANDQLQPNILALNDGSGRFTSAPLQLPPTAHNTLAVELGDVDGDGDLDLALGGGYYVFFGASGFWVTQDGLPELWLNDGNGGFTVSAAAPPEEIPIGALTLADVDGDGHRDWIAAAPSSSGAHWALDLQRTHVWLGDGTGTFTAPLEPLTSADARSWGFAVADVDEDGDLDLLSSSSIQRNVTRQLTRRTYPRVGYPLDFELFGTPGETWFLMSSRESTRVPYGTLGTLLLDRATLTRRDQGVLDTTGRAHATFDIPALPALVDTTIHWQAFIAGQDRLTNLEQTTLSDV